jgi:hypothetical protein
MLEPGFKDFCFVSAFTVHLPPDKDKKKIDQDQQSSAPGPVPELGKEWWVFVEDAFAMRVVVDKVFIVAHLFFSFSLASKDLNTGIK